MERVALTRLIEKMKLNNFTPDINVEDIMLTHSDVNRPALQLAGFFDHFDAERLQLVGNVEYAYMKTLEDDEVAEKVYSSLFSKKMPCLVFCRGLIPCDRLLKVAKEHQIPILGTGRDTSEFMAEVIFWLKRKLAESVTIHGVLVDIYGEGVLIMGESGIGKSEAAVELLRRGHRLVSDDAVEIRKISDDTLIGTSPELTRHLIELRGIGILDVKTIFGVESVKKSQTIDCVVKLVEWNKDTFFDRMGLEDNFMEILGNQVVCYTIPIRPGRNLAVILEAATINFRAKKLGYNAAQDLYEKVTGNLQQKMRKND
ncbi:MAG: HPr(Ser) kinase/phosphatase [Lachnospiraceae bacterium]|nr:HPr(Ser) kinase/phosphatase [Lachnospiraceae bacterium]